MKLPVVIKRRQKLYPLYAVISAVMLGISLLFMFFPFIDAFTTALSGRMLTFYMVLGGVCTMFFSFTTSGIIFSIVSPKTAVKLTKKGIYDHTVAGVGAGFIPREAIVSLKSFGGSKNGFLGLRIDDGYVDSIGGKSRKVRNEINDNIASGLPAVVIKQSDVAMPLGSLSKLIMEAYSQPAEPEKEAEPSSAASSGKTEVFDLPKQDKKPAKEAIPPKEKKKAAETLKAPKKEKKQPVEEPKLEKTSVFATAEEDVYAPEKARVEAKREAPKILILDDEDEKDSGFAFPDSYYGFTPMILEDDDERRARHKASRQPKAKEPKVKEPKVKEPKVKEPKTKEEKVTDLYTESLKALENEESDVGEEFGSIFSPAEAEKPAEDAEEYLLPKTEAEPEIAVESAPEDVPEEEKPEEKREKYKVKSVEELLEELHITGFSLDDDDAK